MPAASEGRACVAESTASAKLVYTVLCHEGPHTQSTLAAKTGLDRKTVGRSTSKLVACGVVDEQVDPTDARRRRYQPAAGCC